MNCLVSDNLSAVVDDRLPPRRRGGMVRMLFMHTPFLGFTTQAGQICKYTQRRDDIAAVHINIVRPLWMKVAGHALCPHGWDLATYRYLLMFRWMLRQWCHGPLDPSRFDVIHIMTQGNALSILDLKQIAGSVPVVISLDATGVLEVKSFGKSRWANSPFIAAERRMFSAADLLICQNQWAAGSLADDYAVPRERILLARPAVLAPEDAAPVVLAGRESSQTRIMFVGNDWERKGGPMLLRLHQQHFADRVQLHIASARVRPDHAARNVVWHGAVNRERLVREILPTMDLLVVPTLHDTMLLAAMEASALGVPVISSAIAAIGEVVDNGVTGLLCPPGDEAAVRQAMERLIDDKPLRQKMGDAARAHIRRYFNPDEQCNLLLDGLVRLANRGR